MEYINWAKLNAYAEPIGYSKSHAVDPDNDDYTLCGVEIPHGGAYADSTTYTDCKRCEKKMA